jgi:phosphatidylglycerophosphate synthase
MSSPNPAAQALTRATAGFVVLGGFLLVGAVGAAGLVTPVGSGFIAGAMLPYAVGALLVTSQVGRHHPHATFGAANLVTLLRLVLTSLVAGFAVEIQLTQAVPSDAILWSVFLVSLVTVSLDGVDGMLARRRGTSSAFGFRFDMETDAFLILMLAVAVFAVNKAGAWVLLSGLLRYLFVFAGWVWPALAAPLPPSMRRKVICVVQSLGLILPLAPVIDPPIGALIAFAALLLLLYSFAVDTLWSLRNGAAQPS